MAKQITLGEPSRAAILRDGVKTVAAGANPMALKRGIDKAVERATDN